MKRFAIACAVAAAGPAFAQYSGAGLQRDMQSTDREKNIAAIYFIGGVVDTSSMIYNVQAFTVEKWDRTLFFCIPESVKLGEIYGVVKARMDKPVIALSEPAAAHVSRILREVWPCPKQ